MQSIKDGPFCFLLTYKDDGCKFGDNAALTNKGAYAVALALLDIWSTMGPPAILGCDNGGEFKGLGKNVSKAANVDLNDKVHSPWQLAVTTCSTTPSLAPLHPHPTWPFPVRPPPPPKP